MNYELFTLINQFAGRYSFLDTFMIYVTNGAIYLYFFTLLFMWLRNDNYRRTAIYAVITGAVSLVLSYIIGVFYFHPRPFVDHSVNLLLPHAADASFPSDHTIGAFALSIIIFLRHKKVGTFVIILAILTGISRVFVGHHYPFDIVGSFLVASLATFLVTKSSSLLEPFVRLILNVNQKIPLIGGKPQMTNKQAKR